MGFVNLVHCLALNIVTLSFIVSGYNHPDPNAGHLARSTSVSSSYMDGKSGLSQGLRPANERRRYFVTTSLIGWVQA